MEKMLLGLLRVLCPYLQAMAKKTATPVDDLVVNLICRIAGTEDEERSK